MISGLQFTPIRQGSQLSPHELPHVVGEDRPHDERCFKNLAEVIVCVAADIIAAPTSAPTEAAGMPLARVEMPPESVVVGGDQKHGVFFPTTADDRNLFCKARLANRFKVVIQSEEDRFNTLCTASL